MLAATLRPADNDAAAGATEEIARIVAQIRAHWPKTRIILRADSGFAREALMARCEAKYRLRLRAGREAAPHAGDRGRTWWRRAKSQTTGEAARRFKQLIWSTRKSWSRRRLVVAKAEWTKGEAQSTLRRYLADTGRRRWPATLRGDLLRRGEMENRIKERQMDLFADRTSTATMKAKRLLQLPHPKAVPARVAWIEFEGTLIARQSIGRVVELYELVGAPLPELDLAKAELHGSVECLERLPVASLMFQGASKSAMIICLRSCWREH